MHGDVLCLSHLRWGFVYQRPNHLMARWARDRRVFFVEEPTFERGQARMDVNEVAPGLRVVTPRLPHGTSPSDAERALREMLDALLARERIVRPLVWFYSPVAMEWAGHVRSSVTVYDCMDELAHFHGAHAELREREQGLFAVADLVFTGGHSLYEAKRRHHPRVHAFPSSVDAAHFAKARVRMDDPPDQAHIGHPRVGFFGVVDERMDLDLLRGVAELRPDLELVVIGPVAKIDPAALPRLRNIHWLGAKKYEELPQYLSRWDAAMMPFARNDATKFISPTKTLEYLAAAKPIVSTSIRDVVRPYGDDGLVRIADTPVAFARAIEAALEDPRENPAREELLSRTSWDQTFSRMRALVEEAATRRRHAHDREEAPCSTT